MPVPQYRAPKDSQPWGLLGAIGRFLSPPGYTPSGPLAQASARAAASQTGGGFNLGRPAAASEVGGEVRPEGSMATLGGKPMQWMDNRWVPFLTEGEMARQQEAEIRAKAPAAPVLPAPQGVLGRSVTPIVQSSDDQYRQLLSQYGGLQKAKKFEEAEKLGMEIWKEKYGKTAMGQPGGAVGTYNPLLAKTFEGENIPSQVQAFTNPQGINEQASFSIAANAVPAPWHTQGAAVSAPYQEAAAKAEEKTNPMNLVSQQGFDPDTLSRVSNFLLKFQK